MSHKVSGNRVHGHEKAGEPVDDSDPDGMDAADNPYCNHGKGVGKSGWCRVVESPSNRAVTLLYPKALKRRIGLIAKQASVVKGHVHE